MRVKAGNTPLRDDLVHSFEMPFLDHYDITREVEERIRAIISAREQRERRDDEREAIWFWQRVLGL
jgi:hypothetical protein